MGARREASILCLPLGLILLWLVATALVGCGSSSAIRINRERTFDAMPARVETMGDEHLVVFTSPTGGWQARFDTDRPMFNGREVFITLTSPDPNTRHTPTPTELRVLTPVTREIAMDVYARVMPFRIEGARGSGLFGFFFQGRGDSPPYQLAARFRPAADNNPAAAPDASPDQ